MQRELAEGSQPPALAGTTGRAAGTVPGAGLTLLSPEFLWALSGTVSSGIAGEGREMKNGFVSLQGERKNSA